MKNISLLVWLTQLGLSVAVPLASFVFLGGWLHRRFSWGIWVGVVGSVIGLLCAADGLRSSLKAMDRLAKKESEDTPPVSFNDHD